jgi:hypothetical protein
MGVSLISLDSTFVIAGKEHMLRLCDLSNTFRSWCPRQAQELQRCHHRNHTVPEETTHRYQISFAVSFV